MTLLGVYTVGQFIITLPVSDFVFGGYIALWYLIIRTLQGLNRLNQACNDRAVTASDSPRENGGYVPLSLAIASVVLVPAQVLILLLDPRPSNVHFLLATVGALHFAAHSVHDRRASLSLRAVSMIGAALAVLLGPIRFVSSSEESVRWEAAQVGVVAGILLFTNIYSLRAIGRGR